MSFMVSCTAPPPTPQQQMNDIAERYVKLVLAVGEHDADYVDAYYGPPSWKQEVKQAVPTLDTIKVHAVELLSSLQQIDLGTLEEIVSLRREYLSKQLKALLARVEWLGGKQFTFDEEALALYDVAPPMYTEDHFQKILDEIDKHLPGTGKVSRRYEQFRKQFIIPPDKVDTVFQTALAEARKRTKQYLTLPANESFTLEYVRNKSWSGYNWYKGNNTSLIQINIDLPIYIDRAVDLAAHEGYPGHHVYNVLLETNLMRGRGWMEFSVYALFSPQSLIAEGSANYGIDVAFPGKERLKFEQEVLFPLAGLDTSRAELYYKVLELVSKLSYAGNEAARRYLDGHITADEAAAWLETYALMSPERAKQRVRFIEQYRSYVINYNLGQDLVKRHIESRGGTADNPEKRWKEFAQLLSSPRLPSSLTK
jgi:hypothetical protein